MPPFTNTFAEKKRKILESLNQPEEAYNDRSPKGSVDVGIRELVEEINAHEAYVTTSSCAGRLAVFLEGAAPKLASPPGTTPIATTTYTTADDGDGDQSKPNGTSSSSSTQGKGGGRWLYVSHEPLDLIYCSQAGVLADLLGLPRDLNSNPISFPPPNEEVRFIHFKFEPMILHILTSSLLTAQHCHSAAMSAGFRESGIAGITGSHPLPHVAIRTQGLALESLVAYQDAENVMHPMVSEEYLRTLVQIANQRFVANAERKDRFRSSLWKTREEKKAGDGVGGAWEPAQRRRERKRVEGLKMREVLKQQQQQQEEEEAEGRNQVRVGEGAKDGGLVFGLLE